MKGLCVSQLNSHTIVKNNVARKSSYMLFIASIIKQHRGLKSYLPPCPHCQSGSYKRAWAQFCSTYTGRPGRWATEEWHPVHRPAPLCTWALLRDIKGEARREERFIHNLHKNVSVELTIVQENRLHSTFLGSCLGRSSLDTTNTHTHFVVNGNTACEQLPAGLKNTTGSHN